MSNNSPKKKKDKVVAGLNFGSGLVSFAAALLAIVMILYSGYVLYDSMAIEVSAFSSNSDLLKYKPSVSVLAQPEGPSLSEVNPDYRGWTTVGGDPASPIDYPIVQGKDDLYYASHDVYNNTSLTGAIYLAAANKADFSDSYNLLYGHHMDNGAMFGSLDKFKDKNYFDTHRTATIVAANGAVYDITFFGLASTDAYENQIYSVGNRAAEVVRFLGGSREEDIGLGTKLIQYSQDAAKGSKKIIALSTCASADTNGRLVLFGRMTPRDNPTPTPSHSGGGGTATATPSPSPSPTPVEQVKLVVKYFEGDTKVFSDEVIYYTPGSDYYVVSPQKPGYNVDIQIVRGTIEGEDITVIVRYTPKETQLELKVRYIYADGTKAAETYREDVPIYGEYSVTSPVIPGYNAQVQKITGTAVPGSKMHYVVIYTPEETELVDPPTPLKLDRTFMQVGICFE
ncbi:MAG: class B sortase [Clostridia bacterium]|nr:class B sortase [Clostridia bacterium]